MVNHFCPYRSKKRCPLWRRAAEKFETLMLPDAIFKGKSRAQSSGRPGSGPSCLEMIANPLSTKIGLTFI